MFRRKALAATTTVLLALTGLVVLATPAAADPLRVHAQARGKIIGNAVDTNEITDAAYRPIIASEFNQLTPGNAMKWDATEPSRGQFNFARADEIVALAQQNNQSVRGHTLVWHSQTRPGCRTCPRPTCVRRCRPTSPPWWTATRATCTRGTW